MVKGVFINLPERLVQMARFTTGTPVALQRVLEDMAKNHILKKSHDRVPVLTGALQDTGRVNKTELSPAGHKRTVTIAYGGISEKFHKFVDYAVIQHEGKFAHRQGQRKFLESAGLETQPLIVASCYDRLNQLLRSIFK